MMRPTVLLKRSLIFVHRWMGVALSVVFMLWFVSGIVMMYWSFPGVSAEARLERAPALDPAQIRYTPEQAYAILDRDQPPGQVILTSYDGRPVYRFGGGGGGRGKGGGGRRGGGGGGVPMVFADDGAVPPEVDDAMVDRAAAAWAKLPLSQAKKESVEEVDQWTVAGNFRTMRPLYKYSFPDGQQVYVNGRTADVVQYTTTESRFWAYLGAIPHWMYFTPLRQHQPQWFGFVVWSSAIGTVAAILGVIVAIWMLSPSKRYRHAGMPTSIPYKGWKRWHTIIGLFFGVVTATWAFSGLLSMGPFRIVDRITELIVPSANKGDLEAAKGKGKGKGKGGNRGPNLANALRGAGPFDLAAYAAKTPRDAIASLGTTFQAKELDFTMFDGEPLYMATDSAGATRIIPLNGEPKPSFSADRVMEIVREAAGKNLAELRMMDEYDAYYLDRRGERPLPVVYARMNDEASTRYYIDPVSGRVAGNYSSRNWISRWMYHGLHSLDFPWLYKHRPLWDIVVITLMLGGTALCLTSLILTYKVLARKLAAALRTRLNQPSEDLALEPVAKGDLP